MKTESNAKHKEQDEALTRKLEEVQRATKEAASSQGGGSSQATATTVQYELRTMAVIGSLGWDASQARGACFHSVHSASCSDGVVSVKDPSRNSRGPHRPRKLPKPPSSPTNENLLGLTPSG